MGRLRGLIVDWGGVLTTSLAQTMAAWCEADGLVLAEFRQLMRDWVASSADQAGAANPVHALERGEIETAVFERELAGRLRSVDGRPIPALGLLDRIFAGFGPDQEMVDAVRRAKATGIATGLLSNSWGNTYPREGWDEMFDTIVISGEVNLRKPDPEIFQLTADRLGLAPPECVFVDDLPVNVAGAEAVGMAGVHHESAAGTISALEGLFGVDLRS